VSLTTVGYGDITPHTPAGKIFTTFYLMIGIGIITTFITYSIRRREVKIADRRKK
jgi:voltage-gated potassium channel